MEDGDDALVDFVEEETAFEERDAERVFLFFEVEGEAETYSEDEGGYGCEEDDAEVESWPVGWRALAGP